MLIETKKHKSLQLQQINNICQQLDPIMDNEVLYTKVVDVIHQNLGYDHVALYLVDYKANLIILRSLAGIYKGLVPPHQKMRIGQGIIGQVVQTDQTVLSNDVSSNSHFYNVAPYKTPTKSELCVPIRIKEKIIGVLNIESTEIMNFSDDDLNSLEVLANRIGVSIHNSMLYNQLEEDTDHLYDIVSSMGQGIILVNKDDEVEWINKTCEKWIKTEGNILGKKCYQVFDKHEHCPECPNKKIFKSGKICRHMLVTKNKYFSVTSAPIKEADGSVKRVLEVLDDVTGYINLRRKLEKTKERLEKLKYLAVLGELTSNIAHEIRNPLNAISASISVLQYDLNIDKENTKLLDIIREETKRLDNIISVYLNYTNNRRIKFAYHDIKKTIEEVILLLNMDENVMENIKIRSHFHNDIPKLKFDHDSIKQVLWNILINSVQSIEAGGIINLTVGRNRDLVSISIQDNGKGIPKHNLKKIFKQFFTTKSGGTGLGLSIVKRILDQHEWSIKVDSKVNIGTCFTIEAPISK